MKNQLFGIIFYSLYLVAMLRPVMPFLDYMINYDYIAEALCENRDKPYLECNGKCYLADQLQQTTHDSHNHESPAPKIDLREYPVSLLTSQEAKAKTLQTNKKRIYFASNIEEQSQQQPAEKPPAIII